MQEAATASSLRDELLDPRPRGGRRPHVVVVGGGFGGLYAAKAFADQPVRVTVVDRRNHHLFQPLLYQVATAALSPGDIAEPIRGVLARQRNTRVFLADVQGVDAANRRVVLADGELKYDYLIMATGAGQSYFGHDEWEPLAPGLKTVRDALEIRRRILLAFEKAERERDVTRCEALLTFVVIGGGPTGVELAGALGEIARKTFARDFRRIDTTQARILLLEGSPRILATYPEKLSAAAERHLEAVGVEVRASARVTKITDDAVFVGEERIPACTVLWAAGVLASPVLKTLGVPLDRAGRVVVEPDLTIPGHPEIYVVGDASSFTHEDGKPLPGVAPVAIQQGIAAAENILRTEAGEPRARFHYENKGSLATVGRGFAVADLGWIQLHGYTAWLAWFFVHIYFLVGFGDRMVVILRWIWAYFTFQRGVRLIAN
ncbi:MAG: NAD(P)/FAD-dependent oxidoreductase [Chloroflexi bacterium]|nr:NAD(P)/FAD-dependent oxidoreductase [Chloroflexota bacterium]